MLVTAVTGTYSPARHTRAGFYYGCGFMMRAAHGEAGLFFCAPLTDGQHFKTQTSHVPGQHYPEVAGSNARVVIRWRPGSTSGSPARGHGRGSCVVLVRRI